MKIFKLKVSKWLHGHKDRTKVFFREDGTSYIPGSMLFRPEDGKMCCLGQYLERCGVPKEKMAYIQTPYQFNDIFSVPKEAKWLVDAEETCTLMQENDGMNEGYPVGKSPVHRSVISKLFAKHGVKVVFVP